jgi:hypothetical protein
MNLNNLVIMPDTTTFQGNSIISYSNIDQKSNFGEDQHPYGNFVNDIFYVIPRRKIDGVGCQKQLIQDFYDILNNKKMYEQQLRREKSTSKTRTEIREKEPFKPKLAPGTNKFTRSQERN